MVPIPKIALVGRVQRGQVHALQPHLRTTQGDHGRPPRLHARPQLRAGHVAGARLRADRHRRPAPRHATIRSWARRRSRRSARSRRRTWSFLVVDARAGLLPDDAAIARELRARGKRVLVAVNKVEGGGDGLGRVRAARLRPPAARLGRARPGRGRPPRRRARGLAPRRARRGRRAAAAARPRGPAQRGEVVAPEPAAGERARGRLADPGHDAGHGGQPLRAQRAPLPPRGHRGPAARAALEGERRPRERRAGASRHRPLRRGRARAGRRRRDCGRWTPRSAATSRRRGGASCWP